MWRHSAKKRTTVSFWRTAERQQQINHHANQSYAQLPQNYFLFKEIQLKLQLQQKPHQSRIVDTIGILPQTTYILAQDDNKKVCRDAQKNLNWKKVQTVGLGASRRNFSRSNLGPLATPFSLLFSFWLGKDRNWPAKRTFQCRNQATKAKCFAAAVHGGEGVGGHTQLYSVRGGISLGGLTLVIITWLMASMGGT